MSNDQGIIFKVLLLGDSTVGKTCFLMRFTDNTFQEVHMSTIGLDYRLKEMKTSDQKTVKVQIWDTAGQDRFRAITKNYYKGADGILLIYDVTNPTSFDNIRTWVSQIKENASNQVKIIIVGNKIDMTDNIKIKTGDVQKLSNEFKLKFFESSAKNNIKIEECFTTLVNDINSDYETSKHETSKLNEKNNSKKGCC